jgi:hypothetical protein
MGRIAVVGPPEAPVILYRACGGETVRVVRVVKIEGVLAGERGDLRWEARGRILGPSEIQWSYGVPPDDWRTTEAPALLTDDALYRAEVDSSWQVIAVVAFEVDELRAAGPGMVVRSDDPSPVPVERFWADAEANCRGS